MSADQPGGFPSIEAWLEATAPLRGGGAAYGRMIAALRRFLDGVAAAKPDEAMIGELAADLEAWTDRLAPLAVPESQQIFARRPDLPSRGSSMLPPFDITARDHDSIRGTVTFGRYHLGGNGAAHGGAIPLLFDDVLGALANSDGRPPARTAYLKLDYRSITPIETPLQFSVRVVSEEGRKHLLRGELRDGERLCAECEGLFITLKPGQP